MTPKLLNTFTSKKTVIGALATVVTGLTLAAGPAAAHAATPTTAQTAPATASVATHSDHRTASKELRVKYQSQPNYFWCGPAAARNALTATGHNITMANLAHQMGTTEAGTNSANDITAALNKVTGSDKYHTTELAKPTVSPKQADTLKRDIVTTIDDNRAVVANVAGTATDTDGTTHSYEGGHYIAVHGYRNHGNQVKIADSANPNTAHYWINTADLADWIATRGYSH
jgi:Peptidase_C39 like family